jgi:hypothetical protein
MDKGCQSLSCLDGCPNHVLGVAPWKRWKDVIRSDLRDIQVEESGWYDRATTSRCEWKSTCRQGVERHQEISCHQRATECRPQQYECEVCHRRFSRDSDRKRHKCVNERSKPAQEQRGAVQCQTCRRWFRSKGGFGCPQMCTYPRVHLKNPCIVLLPLQGLRDR